MRPSLIFRQGGLAESPLGTYSWGKRERTQEKSTKNRSCARSEGGAECPGGWNLDSGQRPFSQERESNPPSSRASLAQEPIIFLGSGQVGETTARKTVA